MACNRFTVPAGKIYFDPFDGDCELTGERYLGETPGAEITVEVSTVEVFGSDDPVSEKLEDIAHAVVRAFQFSAIELSDNIAAQFFAADPATLSQSSGSVTNEAINGVIQGRYYQLGKSASNPTGVRRISAVTVEDADGAAAVAWAATTAKTLGAFGKPTVDNTYYYTVTTAGTTGGSEPTWPTTVGATVNDGTVVWTCTGKITLTVTTDYTVDTDLGRLYIVPNGGIADGTDLLVDYTKAANSRVQHTSTADLNARLRGAIRFIAHNTAGTNRDIWLPKVILMADGATQIKRDGNTGAVQRMGFRINVMKDEDLSAMYIDGRAVA
jgi:hypothetical protein